MSIAAGPFADRVVGELPLPAERERARRGCNPPPMLELVLDVRDDGDGGCGCGCSGLSGTLTVMLGTGEADEAREESRLKVARGAGGVEAVVAFPTPVSVAVSSAGCTLMSGDVCGAGAGATSVFAASGCDFDSGLASWDGRMVVLRSLWVRERAAGLLGLLGIGMRLGLFGRRCAMMMGLELKNYFAKQSERMMLQTARLR